LLKRQITETVFALGGVVPGAGVETGPNVVQIEVGQLFDHLFGGEPVSQQVEYIAHADAHTADARTASALLGVNRDPISH